MSDFKELLTLLEKFRDERDWEQFHDSKNLALALSIEAAELNELFLWKKDAQVEQVDRDRLREELADVFAYAIMLAGRHVLMFRKLSGKRSRLTLKNIRLKNPEARQINTKILSTGKCHL